MNLFNTLFLESYYISLDLSNHVLDVTFYTCMKMPITLIVWLIFSNFPIAFGKARPAPGSVSLKKNTKWPLGHLHTVFVVLPTRFWMWVQIFFHSFCTTFCHRSVLSRLVCVSVCVVVPFTWDFVVNSVEFTRIFCCLALIFVLKP